MTSKMVEGAGADIGFFFLPAWTRHQKTMIRLEHLQLNIKKKSALFNQTCLYIYIYIYIYIYHVKSKAIFFIEKYNLLMYNLTMNWFQWIVYLILCWIITCNLLVNTASVMRKRFYLIFFYNLEHFVENEKDRYISLGEMSCECSGWSRTDCLNPYIYIRCAFNMFPAFFRTGI